MQCIGDTVRRREECIGDNAIRKVCECESVLSILREGVKSVKVYWRHCEKA